MKQNKKTKKIIWRHLVSRLLRGNPAIKKIILFETYDELFKKLRSVLPQGVLSAHPVEKNV